jgi:hypothetical protein
VVPVAVVVKHGVPLTESNRACAQRTVLLPSSKLSVVWYAADSEAPKSPLGDFHETRPGEPRLEIVAQVVVAGERRADEREAGLAAERIAGVEIDHRAQRAFVEAGLGGLVDHQAREQLGGEDVEIEGAVAVGAGAVGRGGDGLEPVEANAGELRAEAANGDRAALAGIALDRDAGDALERFGEVLVGELGDVLGDDRVDRGDRIALDVDRGAERGAESRSPRSRRPAPHRRPAPERRPFPAWSVSPGCSAPGPPAAAAGPNSLAGGTGGRGETRAHGILPSRFLCHRCP